MYGGFGIVNRSLIFTTNYLNTKNADNTERRDVLLGAEFRDGAASPGEMPTLVRTAPNDGSPRAIVLTLTWLTLTPTESVLAQIWEAAAQTRQSYYRHLWVAVLGVLYGGGLRRGEVHLLNLSDWDPETGTLQVYGKKTAHDRRIPLPDLCRQCLEAYLPRRQNTLAKYCLNNEPALFVNGRGRRLSLESISGGIGRLTQASGEKVTLHQYRHTCASQLLTSGTPLPHVQKLLGHKSLQTTMRYLHVADKELHNAVARHPLNDVHATLRPNDAKGDSPS